MSSLDVLAIKIEIISSISDRTSEYGCEYGNSISIPITKSNGCIIYDTACIARLGLTVIYFIIQAMSALLLNIVLSIQFNAIVIAIDELVINLAVQSSIWLVYCDTKVIHNVCAVST